MRIEIAVPAWPVRIIHKAPDLRIGAVAFFKPEVRPGTMTGAQMRGAAAVGRLSPADRSAGSA